MGFDTDRDLGYSAQGPEGGAYSALPVWGEFIKRSQKGVAQDDLPKPADVFKCSNEGISDYCLKGASAVTQVPQGELEEGASNDATQNNEAGSASSDGKEEPVNSAPAEDPEDIF